MINQPQKSDNFFLGLTRFWTWASDFFQLIVKSLIAVWWPNQFAKRLRIHLCFSYSVQQDVLQFQLTNFALDKMKFLANDPWFFVNWSWIARKFISHIWNQKCAKHSFIRKLLKILRIDTFVYTWLRSRWWMERFSFHAFCFFFQFFFFLHTAAGMRA